MLMLDLFAGLGGASQAMRERGWQVVTVELEPKFQPDIIADLTDWHWTGPRPDLIWASPPCTEFARESMPWCRTGKAPDMTLYHAARRIIAETNPRFYVIENVRGAVPYFGRPQAIYGPFFLWGNFPPLGKIRLNMKKKESYGSKQAAERAKVPAALSERLAIILERTNTFEHLQSLQNPRPL